MKRYQILNPEAVRIGPNGLAGAIVSEADLKAAGHSVAVELKAGNIAEYSTDSTKVEEPKTS